MFLAPTSVNDLGAARAEDLAGVDEGVAAIVRGEMVVLVDSSAPDAREQPASLMMAAQKVTPPAVNFMAAQGRGLISVALPRERLARLEIEPMAARPTNPRYAAFHVAVDHRTQTSTGISATDRAATVRALADPGSLPGDFSRPGHVLPVACETDGVPGRPGLREVAVDLVRMAGLFPAGALCEILAEDGEPARPAELLEFGARHDLPVVAVGR
ncbi:MAG: 3,4-dihydroxy-2-butanone-4-phosphate synthase [Actinobacteria bacterium]|nr:3,4-dihydroxy-2-butanone-4-phosphate synthase [Actinomycetota bacterium]